MIHIYRVHSTQWKGFQEFTHYLLASKIRILIQTGDFTPKPVLFWGRALPESAQDYSWEFPWWYLCSFLGWRWWHSWGCSGLIPGELGEPKWMLGTEPSQLHSKQALYLLSWVMTQASLVDLGAGNSNLDWRCKARTLNPVFPLCSDQIIFFHYPKLHLEWLWGGYCFSDVGDQTQGLYIWNKWSCFCCNLKRECVEDDQALSHPFSWCFNVIVRFWDNADITFSHYGR